MTRLSTSAGARGVGRFRLPLGVLLRRSNNDRSSSRDGGRRVAKFLLRGTVAVLVVTLYLYVFVTLEDNHISSSSSSQHGNYSYESVLAVNQLGQEAHRTALQERNFTRIRRAQERAEQLRPIARPLGPDRAADDDGDPVVPTGERNESDFNLWRFFMFYMLLRLLLRSSSRESSAWWDEDQHPAMADTNMRVRQNERQQRFREWADRLNAQRVATGHRPLSLESLQLVLRERELHDGHDYDGLLQFHEESGPAIEALLHSGGLTAAELEQLPLRVVHAGDDLLRSDSNDGSYFCSVCLEAYVEGDTVRTIPCFHTFHQRCIDDWLSRRAICPICKHSAAG